MRLLLAPHRSHVNDLRGELDAGFYEAMCEGGQGSRTSTRSAARS
jgi:hypothetical protein